MKANELMIGDWIEWKCATEEKYHGIYKIAAIEEGWVDFYDEKGYCCSQPYDEIHPVPLTVEIIDKNFPQGKDRSIPQLKEWFFSDDTTKMFKIMIQVIDIANYDKIAVAIKVLRGGNLVILLQYVHELQHALRLLGIEKEIVL